MNRLAVFLVFLPAHLLLTAPATAQDAIHMSNGLSQPIYIWFWPRDATDWTRPPLLLPREGSVEVNLVSKGDYYLAAVDLAGNEDHLSWIDLLKLARKIPNAKVRVTGGYVTETRMETATVQTYAPLTKTYWVKEIVLRPVVGADGCTRYERVEVYSKRTYTVLVPQQHQLQRPVYVKRLRVHLMVEQNGRLIPLSEVLDGKSQ
jgi:hypothetical protein